MAEVKYPDITVQLSGANGNAVLIISAVARALRRGGVAPHEVQRFREEAKSGDYDNVLATCTRWVDVE